MANTKRRLKYLGYSVVMQEVPDEISLVFNISGCPHHCEGCHSEFLWDYKGDYLSDDLERVINEYSGLITCVCFMGGDQNIEELESYLKTVKDLGLKTCVYSGSDDQSIFNDCMKYLDWLKIGSYDNTQLSDNHVEYGVKLASINQHMIKVH